MITLYWKVDLDYPLVLNPTIAFILEVTPNENLPVDSIYFIYKEKLLKVDCCYDKYLLKKRGKDYV